MIINRNNTLNLMTNLFTMIFPIIPSRKPNDLTTSITNRDGEIPINYFTLWIRHILPNHERSSTY